MKTITYDELFNGMIGAVSVVFMLVGILGAVGTLPMIFVYAIAATSALTVIITGTMVCCVQPFVGKLKARIANHVR